MKIKHNETCKMAFGKPSKHNKCPRCEELKAGAEPRSGWGLSAYQKRVNERSHQEGLRRNREAIAAGRPWDATYGD